MREAPSVESSSTETAPPLNLASRGPGALRTLRELKGLTQASLAQRSGVSVRTIRMLENGRIETPRVGTLDALVSAARLTPAEEASFRRAWFAADELKPFSSLGEQGALVDQLLAEAKFRRPAGLRTLSTVGRTTVGTNRRTSFSETQTVLMAGREPVSRVVRVGTGDQANDICVEDFEAVHGCRLIDTISVEEQNLRVYYLELEPPIPAGGQRLVAYRQVARASPRALTDSDGISTGSTVRTPTTRVDVLFQGERPSRIWELQRLPDSQDFERLRPVEIDNSGCASITRVNIPAGHSCGLTWEWAR